MNVKMVSCLKKTGLTSIAQIRLKILVWAIFRSGKGENVIDRKDGYIISKEICKSRFERRSKMPYITIESGVLTDAQKEE